MDLFPLSDRQPFPYSWQKPLTASNAPTSEKPSKKPAATKLKQQKPSACAPQTSLALWNSWVCGRCIWPCIYAYIQAWHFSQKSM